MKKTRLNKDWGLLGSAGEIETLIKSIKSHLFVTEVELDIESGNVTFNGRSMPMYRVIRVKGRYRLEQLRTAK